MKFSTIRIEGPIFSADILEKIRNEELHGQQAKDFGFSSNIKVKDEIARAWADANDYWRIFRRQMERMGGSGTGTSETRRNWINPLLGLLGYETELSQAETINGKTYAISHRDRNLDKFAVHIMGFNDNLDRKREDSGPRMSPHALVQEYLNLTEHLYAIVTNGLLLRVLRDSSRLIKLSFIEFDLERMMEEGQYNDFAVMFRLIHASRMPKTFDAGAQSLIENYHQDALESGSRIRDGLSDAVREAIFKFGNGFVSHRANGELRKSLAENHISPDTIFQNLLRLIYRLLFLMVIEERNLIYPKNADKKKKQVYYDFYSLARLRTLSENIFIGEERNTDLWQGLKLTFRLFESAKYGSPLDIQPLAGELFGLSGIGDLAYCELNNTVLLDCLYNLSIFTNKNNNQKIKVNYAALNVEEFGSVYEGLLEFRPVIENNTTTGETKFNLTKGTERSSSGSHYTPDELVQPLIKHSLDYIIEDRIKTPDQFIENPGLASLKEKQKQALLSIKVCDVACGSGHILLNAARRIGVEIAKIETGEDQPSPEPLRKAIREVINNCIYGVDKNPLAVELCKVSLWLEAHNPGEPLNFLDHHIKCGDAIVGLAHKEELENGIANEAFKTLPGDDKEIVGLYAKQNKSERKQRVTEGFQLTSEFDKPIDNTVQEAVTEYQAFNRLPEKTPGEIETKKNAYKRFMDGRGYSFLKLMADLQLAQFFIPKTTSQKLNLLTDGEYRMMLHGYKPWQIPKSAMATVVAQEKRFFHWFLEFPEVFQVGGFDCILGNPPYLGGTKISSFNGDSYFNFCKYYYFPAAGRCDLVGYFIRRIFLIQTDKGFHSIITTSTIAEGDTREGGLDIVVQNGGNIVYAEKGIIWPGTANVVVTLYSLYKGEWKTKKLISKEIVTHITPYLTKDVFQNTPFQLKSNEKQAFMGSSITGDGFIIDEKDYHKLISDNPKNDEVIYSYVNGSDFNNIPSHRSKKFIINFFDADLDFITNKYPQLIEIVERLVRPEREKKSPEVASAPWWKYWRIREELYSSISKNNKVLILTRATSTHGLAFLENYKYVFSDAVIVFKFDNFSNFAILQSTTHEDWSWRFSSRLKNDRRYSITDAYETYPFPNIIINEHVLVNIGNRYHDFRRQLMLSVQIGLTKTYNLFHSQNLQIMQAGDESLADKEFEKKFGKDAILLRKHLVKTPGTCSFDEAVEGIFKLRKLHVELDQAVLETYGWQDVQLKHDFYEVDYLPENDRIRFTIHPEARREILKRLLELNHKIHEEELKAGLWDKKVKKAST